MNILEAINNITQIDFSKVAVKEITIGNNRAQNMGRGLEEFVMNAFANSFLIEDQKTLNAEYEKVFSFQGSKRNPPDLMLENGAALEIKKQESLNVELQLNSSHPKQFLKCDSPLITKTCRESEDWSQKDFIYIIGHIPKETKTLSSIWFVYGEIYAASEEVYLSLKEQIQTNLMEDQSIPFSETQELGRVNEIDPLKITNLRVRGMWLLKQPFQVFDYVHDYNPKCTFQCITLIPTSKYEALPKESRDKIDGNELIVVTDVQIRNPDNPVKLINCKRIYYSF